MPATIPKSMLSLSASSLSSSGGSFPSPRANGSSIAMFSSMRTAGKFGGQSNGLVVGSPSEHKGKEKSDKKKSEKTTTTTNQEKLDVVDSDVKANTKEKRSSPSKPSKSSVPKSPRISEQSKEEKSYESNSPPSVHKKEKRDKEKRGKKKEKTEKSENQK